MAAARRNHATPLIDRLYREPWGFEFCQAVRILEWSGARGVGGRRLQAVGGTAAPEDEAVRFRGLVSRSFPVAEVHELSSTEDGAGSLPTPEMTVSFLSLYGPNGALPHHDTQEVIDEVRKKRESPVDGPRERSALRDFLDIFNHRFVSLFYRAWQKYRLPIAYERQRTTPDSPADATSLALLSVVGLGSPALRDRLSVQDASLIYYGGLFAHFPRCAVSLERMLVDYFAMPIQVIQFHGHWLELDELDQSEMPTLDTPLGRNAVLGDSLIVGTRVWSVEGYLRFRVGPVTYAQFHTLMPTQSCLRQLAQIVRTYVGAETAFDIQVVLDKSEVPGLELNHLAAEPACLGWNTWLASQPFAQDVDDAVFTQSGDPPT